MEGTLAEIRMFAGTFAPRGWMLCNGQLLAISQWTAVFALVGTTYGGNGQTTFALPDFRSRMALGTGSGPGLPNINLGEVSGTESVTLLSTNLPAHTHIATMSVVPKAAADGALGSDATNRRPGPGVFYSGSADDLVNMAPIPVNFTTGISGSNQPVNIRCPYLGINHIMCVEGIFPSRN
jgi:microcystin-dependent protein